MSSEAATVAKITPSEPIRISSSHHATSAPSIRVTNTSENNNNGGGGGSGVGGRSTPTSLTSSPNATAIAPSTSAGGGSGSGSPRVKNPSIKLTPSANNLLLQNGGVGAVAGVGVGCGLQQVSIEETPNKLVYKRAETLIERMQEETGGVPIRTVKSFMSKIPSVFTGTDLIQWMLKKLDVEDTLEALHFAHLISSHGYIFPIDDHILTVKNDGTFFRFQVRSIDQ